MKIALKISILLFCIFLVPDLFSQKKYDFKNKGAISRITTSSEFVLKRDKIFFYESTVSLSDPDEEIQWYKIVFIKDCFFDFTIIPLHKIDKYIYRVFKIPQNQNFCDALANQKIEVVNGIRIYKSEKNENVVFTQKTAVKAGDAIYIILKNLWGKDLGHLITIGTCDYSYSLKTVKQSSLLDTMIRVRTHYGNITNESAFSAVSKKLCTPEDQQHTSIQFLDNEIVLSNYKRSEDMMLEPLVTATPTVSIVPTILITPQIKADSAESQETVEKSNKVKNNVSTRFIPVKCLIIDEDKGTHIDFKPKIIDELTGKIVELKPLIKGEYELIVEKGKNYKVECTIMGYKNYDRSVTISKLINGEENEFEISLKPMKAGENFILNNIYFHPNTPVFKAESSKELSNLLEFMKNNPEAIISIEGHTNSNRYISRDKRRSQMGNKWDFHGTAKKLSKSRASEVKEYLVKKGIDGKRVKTKGWGGNRELYPGAKSLEESSKNMRVEIHIITI